MKRASRIRGRKWDDAVDFRLYDQYTRGANEEHLSLTERVRRDVRFTILHEHVPQGSWLRPEHIASRLKVSTTPVREAFRSLSKEGLIEIVPYYGVRVSHLSLEEFEEIYEMRVAAEALATRRAVSVLSDDYQEVLETAFNKVCRLAETASLEDYLPKEWQFRYTLYTLASSSQFLSQIQDLREQAERYLRRAYTNRESIASSLAFHEELLHACRAKDVDRAATTVQRALRWTLQTVSPIIRSQKTLHE